MDTISINNKEQFYKKKYLKYKLKYKKLHYGGTFK